MFTNSELQRWGRAVVTAIEERVQRIAVSMEVAVQNNLAILLQRRNHVLCVENCRVEVGIGALESSVQINAGQIAAIVAQQHAICASRDELMGVGKLNVRQAWI